jgi:hypothetical protein
MLHRPVLAVVGWLAAAVAATLTGLVAVQVIGDGIAVSAGGEVVTPQQVARQLASETASPPAGPSPSSPAVTPTAGASSTAAATKVLSTPGGSVVAKCQGTTVRLVSWAPAPGFGVKRADRGPDEHADVTFEGSAGKVELRVRCVNGRPTASWKQDD